MEDLLSHILFRLLLVMLIFFSGLWLYIMVFYCLCVFSVYVNVNLGICMYFLCLLFRSFISLFPLILICLFLFYIIVVSDACEFSIEREK